MDGTLSGGLFFFPFFSFFFATFISGLVGEEEGGVFLFKKVYKKKFKLWLRIPALRDKVWCTVSEQLC